MKKVIIASKNAVKIDAARIALERMFPEERFECVGVSVPSGVADQPMTDAETYQGALNRVNGIREADPEADYWFAFEGGLEEKAGEMECFAWALVMNKDGKLGRARTSTFFLPHRIAELIREGKELGDADDIVFGRTNSKQSNGAVGILSKDLITRTTYYVDAGILALIPFANSELY